MQRLNKLNNMIFMYKVLKWIKLISPLFIVEIFYINNIFYKDIVFVFYLAIDKGTREQGYGTKVLDSIKQKYKNSRIILCIEPVDENSDNYEQRVKRKKFYLKNGFEDSNYIIKERNIIYEMLYYNENVALQEFEEMMKNYFGKMLYEKFYKK